MNKKIENMSNKEYHEHRALGSTDLGKIHKSVANYDHCKDNPKKETKALKTGRLLHTLVLEPEKAQSEYVIEPAKVLKKDVGAEAYEAYKKACKDLEGTDKTVIKQDVYEQVENMATNLLSSELMQAMIKKGKIEESYFWTDKETGIECKCRPDIYVEELGIVIDLKSTEDLTPQDWRRAMVKWSYDRQAAHYMNGIEAVTGTRPKAFVHAVVEKLEPHDFAFFQIDDASLEVGEQLVRKALRRYKNAQDGKEARTLPKDIQVIGLTAYGFDVENR
jgi:hypothetical protein